MFKWIGNQLLLTLVFTITTGLWVITNGIALYLLWGWFIIPVFGVPALSLYSAMGVLWVVNFLQEDLNDHNIPKSLERMPCSDDAHLEERLFVMWCTLKKSYIVLKPLRYTCITRPAIFIVWGYVLKLCIGI